MAVKTILAYFRSPAEAEGVSRKLQALRAIDMSIDRVGEYPGDGIDQVMNPITSDFSGLGDLTLGADFDDKDAAVLAAADPSASGMSGNTDPDMMGYNVLLTAVLDEASHDKALQVVREGGGIL